MKILRNTSALAETATNRLNGAMAPISLLMKGPHTLANWYAINPNMTDIIDGLDILEDYISADSHVVYDKIENLILFGADEIISACTFDDDEGSTIELSGTIGVFADTVSVRAGSYFTLNVIHKPYLFKVMNFTKNTVNDSPCYSVDWKLVHTTKDKLDQLERQVKREYIMTVSKLGPDESFVVDKKVYYDRRNLSLNYIDLINHYVDLFFDKNRSTFILNFASEVVIDDVLNKFMYDNGVIIYDAVVTYAQNNYDGRFESIFMNEPRFVSDYDYKCSVLHQYTKGTFKSEKTSPLQHNYSTQLTRSFRSPVKLIGEYSTLQGIPELTVFDEGFMNKLKSGTLYLETDSVTNWKIKNALIDGFHKREVDFTVIEVSDEKNLENFYLIPLLAYICQREILSMK